MINHHPEWHWLQAFAADTLPLSLALAVAAHVERCPGCATKLAEYEAELAHRLLGDELAPSAANAQPLAPELEAMLLQIMTHGSAAPATISPEPASTLLWAGREIRLPRALRHLALPAWQQLGKIGRARLEVSAEDGARASLLAIEAGCAIPEHTHKGYELTLLLDGSMEDEQGCYGVGDFLLLDGRHQHAPVTREGCLCYLVLDAPLQFTKGWPRLLNGLGSLLY